MQNKVNITINIPTGLRKSKCHPNQQRNLQDEDHRSFAFPLWLWQWVIQWRSRISVWYQTVHFSGAYCHNKFERKWSENVQKHAIAKGFLFGYSLSLSLSLLNVKFKKKSQQHTMFHPNRLGSWWDNLCWNTCSLTHLWQWMNLNVIQTCIKMTGIITASLNEINP